MAQQMKDLLWKLEEQSQDSCKIGEVLLGRVPDNLAPTRDRRFKEQANQLDQPIQEFQILSKMWNVIKEDTPNQSLAFTHTCMHPTLKNIYTDSHIHY